MSIALYRVEQKLLKNVKAAVSETLDALKAIIPKDDDTDIEDRFQSRADRLIEICNHSSMPEKKDLEEFFTDANKEAVEIATRVLNDAMKMDMGKMAASCAYREFFGQGE